MRVTKNMIISSFMDNVARAEERNMRNQQRVSSGLEVEKPSDNPAAASRILSLRSSLAGIEQHQSNVDHIMYWTAQTSTILQSASDIFLSAQELAQRGANETLTDNQKSEMAEEVNQLLEALVEHANQKIDNYYTFGGNYMDGPPYIVTRNADGEIDSVTLDTQTGIDVQRFEEVLDGQTAAVNETGADTFQTAAGLDLFEVLEDLRDNLRANDMSAIDTSFNQVKDAETHLNLRLDRIGGRDRWLEAIKTRLDEASYNATDMKASYEETDLTQAIVDLQSDQIAYQAALQAGAASIQMSLMNFLQ